MDMADFLLRALTVPGPSASRRFMRIQTEPSSKVAPVAVERPGALDVVQDSSGGFDEPGGPASR